jgi:hypothetical protein
LVSRVEVPLRGQAKAGNEKDTIDAIRKFFFIIFDVIRFLTKIFFKENLLIPLKNFIAPFKTNNAVVGVFTNNGIPPI